MMAVGHTLFKWLINCTAKPYQTHVCSSLKMQNSDEFILKLLYNKIFTQIQGDLEVVDINV
jgi:hypothetical protein